MICENDDLSLGVQHSMEASADHLSGNCEMIFRGNVQHSQWSTGEPYSIRLLKRLLCIVRLGSGDSVKSLKSL